MAQRRMFAKNVVETDDFYDLTVQAQTLYFHLCMTADDDGFTKSKRSVLKLLNLNDSAYDELLASNYIIDFPTGVCCIIHWKMSNCIQKDRYTKTVYNNELSMIESINGVYQEKEQYIPSIPDE